MTVPWHNVARGLTRAEDVNGITPGAVAGIDRAGAEVRETLARYSVDLDYPEHVFVALVILDVLHERTFRALRERLLCKHGAQDALALVKSLELTVALYAPDEARSNEGDRP